jgi:hypothetical protein
MSVSVDWTALSSSPEFQHFTTTANRIHGAVSAFNIERKSKFLKLTSSLLKEAKKDKDTIDGLLTKLRKGIPIEGDSRDVFQQLDDTEQLRTANERKLKELTLESMILDDSGSRWRLRSASESGTDFVGVEDFTIDGLACTFAISYDKTADAFSGQIFDLNLAACAFDMKMNSSSGGMKFLAAIVRPKFMEVSVKAKCVQFALCLTGGKKASRFKVDRKNCSVNLDVKARTSANGKQSGGKVLKQIAEQNCYNFLDRICLNLPKQLFTILTNKNTNVHISGNVNVQGTIPGKVWIAKLTDRKTAEAKKAAELLFGADLPLQPAMIGQNSIKKNKKVEATSLWELRFKTITKLISKTKMASTGDLKSLSLRSLHKYLNKYQEADKTLSVPEDTTTLWEQLLEAWKGVLCIPELAGEELVDGKCQDWVTALFAHVADMSDRQMEVQAALSGVDLGVPVMLATSTVLGAMSSELAIGGHKITPGKIQSVLDTVHSAEVKGSTVFNPGHEHLGLLLSGSQFASSHSGLDRIGELFTALRVASKSERASNAAKAASQHVSAQDVRVVMNKDGYAIGCIPFHVGGGKTTTTTTTEAGEEEEDGEETKQSLAASKEEQYQLLFKTRGLCVALLPSGETILKRPEKRSLSASVSTPNIHKLRLAQPPAQPRRDPDDAVSPEDLALFAGQTSYLERDKTNERPVAVLSADHLSAAFPLAALGVTGQLTPKLCLYEFQSALKISVIPDEHKTEVPASASDSDTIPVQDNKLCTIKSSRGKPPLAVKLSFPLTYIV